VARQNRWDWGNEVGSLAMAAERSKNLAQGEAQRNPGLAPQNRPPCKGAQEIPCLAQRIVWCSMVRRWASSSSPSIWHVFVLALLAGALSPATTAGLRAFVPHRVLLSQSHGPLPRLPWS
jgi:hypothetical protein